MAFPTASPIPRPDRLPSWTYSVSALSTRLLANAAIGELTGAALPQAVLDGAWSRQQVTWDPLRQTILESAWSAYQAGYLDSEPDLRELVDLSLLNPILESRGLPVIP